LQDWETKPKISIHEALHVISIMGGQAFFFCNCKEVVTKIVANAKRMEGHATVSVTLPIGCVSMKQLRLSAVTGY
jgi:hypothetical protein